MKKAILCFVTSLLIFTVQSQEIFQIDSTSKWIQAETWAGSFEWEEWNYSLTFNGDTLINDTLFSKMFLNGRYFWDYHGYGSGVDTVYNQYFGAVVEESGKIFMVLPDSSSAIPLYDFNYSINDTINTIVGNGLTIIDIDTLENGRKKYITNSSDQLFIVEGIGCNLGFYHIVERVPEWLIDTTLGCYYQNDSLIFLNNSNVCYFPLPVGIADRKQTGIAYLYPNPASSTLTIHYNEPINSVSIIDLNGRTQNVKFEAPDLVNLSSLKNGLYLLIVNNKQTFKFIKK
jgi:hypothetical protein